MRCRPGPEPVLTPAGVRRRFRAEGAAMPTTATLLNIASWLLPLIFAITLHEVAHGLVAKIFGDHTARDMGRLSLNPLRHVDPIGTLVLPMMLAIGGAPVFGWAKPVPV